MQRKRFNNKVIEGQVFPIPIRLWANVDLIDAKDKTTKAKRKGNYYIPVRTISRNGVVYNKYMPVDQFNYKYQAGDAGNLPIKGHKR
jgi:hypothetical protein